uniref:Death domain-containing protein n=1 Tax=Amphimedon queenslandica TaxID=400682 RepID=A0A1X7TT12_AMPQE
MSFDRAFDAFLSSPPTIKELTGHVDASTNWYIIGTMLDLDQKRLRSIEALAGHTDTHKMIEMFNLWLTTTPTASRRQVLDVLRIRVVGENTLADEYEKHLKELHETIYMSPSTEAVSILQRNIESLNEALVSPVQVSQLLYCKRCISEATLDEMERIDQRRSLDDKKTTLLTAMQETVSSDYRKLKDIATVLSDVEQTRDIANEIMTKYEETIPQEDDSTVVQPQEVVGGNEDRASDILRNNYSALSQSITEPVRVAKWLHEEVNLISDEDLSCVMSTSRAVLLKAVRDAVHSNYKHLELFVTVLRKFSETTHIGDTIFEEYKLILLKKLYLSDEFESIGKLQTLLQNLQEENKRLKAIIIQKEEEMIAVERETESRDEEIKELKQKHENLLKAKEESFAKEVLVLNEQASQMKEELSSINNELKRSEGMSLALGLFMKDMYLESNEELKEELQAKCKMSRAKDAEIEMLKKENKDIKIHAEPTVFDDTGETAQPGSVVCVHSGSAQYSSESSTQESKALPISKEPLSVTETREKEPALDQCQDLELSKENPKTEKRPEFKAPSTAAIGFLYTTFIVLLVAICWQPDPSIFISSLPGVEVIASHKFLVAGGQSSQLHWDEYGLMLDIPSDALPCGFVAEVVIRVSVSGPYVYPDLKTWKPASAVYWISSSKEFVNPILLGIWHNVKGSVNSSSIKVLTAEDTPQNMSYIFNEFLGDFTVKGSYVYFKLTGFSGKKVVTSLDVRNFQGSLFYKMSDAGNKWKYSLVIYNSHTKGVTRSLFDGTQYEDWILDIKFDVKFEENSKILELIITPDPPLENWIIRGRINPLSYHKDALQSQGHIVSNMRFDIHWNGSSDLLTDDYLNFPLKGAEYPLSITANPSRIDHKTSANISFTKKKRGIKLDIKDLNDIDLILKSSSFDNSKWSDLGLKLGLFQTRLNTIKSDNSQDAKACLGETLGKWLNRVDEVDKNGGATWEALMDALEKIEQKPVAEKIKDYID